MGDAFGSEVEPDYCDAESGGMHVWVNLGKDTATVYATGPEAPPYDVPSTIAPMAPTQRSSHMNQNRR